MAKMTSGQKWSPFPRYRPKDHRCHQRSKTCPWNHPWWLCNWDRQEHHSWKWLRWECKEEIALWFPDGPANWQCSVQYWIYQRVKHVRLVHRLLSILIFTFQISLLMNLLSFDFYFECGKYLLVFSQNLRLANQCWVCYEKDMVGFTKNKNKIKK